MAGFMANDVDFLFLAGIQAISLDHMIATTMSYPYVFQVGSGTMEEERTPAGI